MLQVGSLFSGIGGIELGLERTGGFQTAFQCEIDPFCYSVLAHPWPDVPRFADVRLLTADLLPPIDLLAGGFPCQDISLAGQRKGLSGARSSLWFEFLRLIREIRPRYVLIENVASLLYALDKSEEEPSASIQRILLDLASIGYDAEWRTFYACQFGLPQYRQRSVIVAYPNGRGWFSCFAQSPAFILPSSEGAGSKLDRRGALLEEYESRLGEPAVFGADPRIPYRLERLKAIGNSVVPVIAEYIGRLILQFEATHAG